MHRLQAAVLAFALLALPVLGETDAIAADSPFADPACPKLAEVTALLDKQHETYVVLDLTDLLNVAPTSPTHILVATFGDYAAFGFEDPSGCLTGPTPLAKLAPKVGA